MKKLITSIFAMAFIATSLQAADIIVDSNGTGDYYTIQEAIDSANAGDRILVIPHGTPYIGALVINKSIELLSQIEGQRFKQQGHVQINLNSLLPANSSITIQSMHNLSGSIYSSFAGNGDRNRVNIVNCKLVSGAIVFDQMKYDLRIQNDSLMDGYITMRYGRVTGCYINNTSHNLSNIRINQDVATDDYIYIVGNKIVGPFISAVNYVFYWNTAMQYFYIANNYMIANNVNWTTLYCSTSKTGSAKDNLILNNTFNKAGTSYWTIQLTNSLSPIKINNNLFAGTSSLGVYGANAPLLSVSYNHFHTSYSSALALLVNDGTNTVSFQVINVEGMPTAGSAINGGDPDASHTDLDGTPNDAGCFGGSYSRANFLAPSSGARTAFVIAPRKVIIGEPIDIFVEGFDY